jgi:hypothetical protein
MKVFVTLATLLAALSLGCSSSGSHSKHAQPSMEDMMAAMMTAGTPGAEHRKLDPFVGTWSAEVKMFMDPAAGPEVSTGVMVNLWILDGRYLEGSFEGNFGGMPFEGRSIWGFDVAAGKYVGSWTDSMSTAISTSSGPISKDGKNFTLQMVNTDPMTGKAAYGEELITIDSDSQHTMTMFEMHDGKKVKTMEIVYTRL